ncbi:helix-turn-helix domain-containing protein [Dyella sp. 2RAB6]|uniref:helix-turn-helix domain-containing protein n=1 Tax=Dyella sp. 2RAB6 TaxID=3232992 RepID=UPI003F8E76F2
MTALRQGIPSLPPTPEEAEAARSSGRLLAAYLGEGGSGRIMVIDGDGTIDVPVSALRMLVEILANMAEGKAVNIIPVKAELTTQQAADFLNVSRPHLVSLLEAGAIDFHKTGTHRRIYASDLLAYHQQRDAQSRSALDELAAQAQELGLGY